MTIYHTTEKFVGREQEIKIFTEWLTDADGPWLLFFHDALEDGERKGGIGKTMLLKQCIKLLREQDKYIIVDMIDFFNIADRSGITIAERVIQALQKRFPGWGGQPEQTLNEYKEYLSRYHLMASSGNGNMQDVPSRLQTIREQLADALSNELQQLHQRMVEMDIYVLLFFDTFELIEHNPITTVLHSSHTFPDNYHFDRIRAVIAGRNEPDWSHSPNWIGRQDEVHTVALSPFSKEEVAEYLRNHSLSDTELTSQALDVILENTEGRPILVGLVADVINKTIPSDDLIAIPKSQFKERLADQINDLDGPVAGPMAWAVLFMAHFYQRFNEKLLTMIMDETGLRNNVPAMNYDELRVKLPLLSFIRRASSGSDFVLHDEMRRLVNMYCWNKRDPERTFRHDLSQLAITYYKEQIEKTHDEEIRQSYIVEMLYHELFKDGKHIEKGFDFFKQHFDEAVGLSLKTFARSLLQEAQKFEKQMTSAQHRDLKLAEARILREEQSAEAALHIYDELEHDNVWAEEHRAEFLYDKGVCYMLMSQFPEAIASLTIASLEAWRQRKQSRKDMRRYAQSLHLLGYIHRRQSQYDDAMRFYEASERVSRDLDDQQLHATVLNDMGNVRRLQGKLDEALHLCKLALHIRREQFRQGKISELDVGLSLSTLGHIYYVKSDIIEEERAYREAFDIYNRIGDRRAIAATHNRLGRIYARRGELEKALPEFQQAYRIAQGIDREAEIESLSQQGRTFLYTEKWEEAIPYFEQAIKLCQQVKDAFHESENLLYLAETLDHLGKPTQELMREAKRIALQINDKFLLGFANRIRGGMHYRRREYAATFRYYRVACKYMALYDPIEFEKILRRLFDLLLDPDIPNTQLISAIDSLLEYWYDLGLDKVYPQLPDICKKVRMEIVL